MRHVPAGTPGAPRRPASCVVWIFSKLDLYADDETNRRVRAVLAFLKS
ncbi:hypothetical protein [Blastococcus sp. Marseille-P5729]|nr:hypothetical protein [Blastococcus sp. Marseille-P5729]